MQNSPQMQTVLLRTFCFIFFIMAVRNSGIGRRLSYTLLSKAHSPDFAKAAYDDARAKANHELLPKKAPSEHVRLEDDEQVS